MKLNLYFILAGNIILLLLSCDKNPSGINFCQNCDMKTDGIEIAENKTGWIIFDIKYNKYGIEVPHYNNPIAYIPCSIPGYFKPVEMTPVVFSGTVIEDPFITEDIIPATYYCIRLDTIHLNTIK